MHNVHVMMACTMSMSCFINVIMLVEKVFTKQSRIDKKSCKMWLSKSRLVSYEATWHS